MSTLISDLESTPAITDGDFVQNILAEMNSGGGGGGGGGGSGGGQLPPAVGGPIQGMISAPNPNTFASRQMDSGPSTAHIIGNSQPTAADFANVMAGAGALGSQNPAVLAQQFGGGAPVLQDSPSKLSAYIPRKSWWSRILDELRAPVGVAVLVFLFSLPVVNFLFAHYIPWMVKSTGELTMIGLLIKSLVAGSSYWILQRVVVPLLSL